MGKFIQIHLLTSYPASLLNRDDLGGAKRIHVGDAERLRISSQCQKRHWRTATGPWSLATAAQEAAGDAAPRPSVSSRRIFEELLVMPLVEEGFDQDAVDIVVAGLRDAMLGKSKKAAGEDADEKKSKKDAERAPVLTEQVVRMGYPEIRATHGYARQILREARVPAGSTAKAVATAAKEALANALKTDAFKKNLAAIVAPGGLDAALCGRMVTSDILARCDAALHVAHAFTVHAARVESDYFAAVDDLNVRDGVADSGHINAAELSTGLYYGYVTIDVPLLVSNLTGRPASRWRDADRAAAAAIVRAFVHLAATVSPGAKLGATAPYSRAQLVLVEWGDAAPRQLADAFLAAVPTTADVRAGAYRALAAHVKDLDRLYGRETDRVMAALGAERRLFEGAVEQIDASLAEAADWAAARVLE